MRVKCIEIRAQELPVEYIALGYTRQTDFGLELNQEYTVYAMALWKGQLMFLLLAGQTSVAHWYPAALFRVIDDSLAPTWKFSYWAWETGIEVQAVWGYEELARDLTHFDKLAQHDEEAVMIFHRRKAEIDSL